MNGVSEKILNLLLGRHRKTSGRSGCLRPTFSHLTSNTCQSQVQKWQQNRKEEEGYKEVRMPAIPERRGKHVDTVREEEEREITKKKANEVVPEVCGERIYIYSFRWVGTTTMLLCSYKKRGGGSNDALDKSKLDFFPLRIFPAEAKTRRGIKKG